MKQTLDYMWEIIPNYNLDIYQKSQGQFNILTESEDEKSDDEENTKIKVLYDTFKVEEFLVKNRPYQQLSDHFGISVELSANSTDSF